MASSDQGNKPFNAELQGPTSQQLPMGFGTPFPGDAFLPTGTVLWVNDAPGVPPPPTVPQVPPALQKHKNEQREQSKQRCKNWRETQKVKAAQLQVQAAAAVLENAAAKAASSLPPAATTVASVAARPKPVVAVAVPAPPRQPTQPTLPLLAAELTEQPMLLEGIGLELAERILMDEQVQQLNIVPEDHTRRTYHDTATGGQSSASLDACALVNGETYLKELVIVDSETREFTEIVQLILGSQTVASRGINGKLGIFEPNFLTTDHSHPECVVVNLGMGEKLWRTAAPGCAGADFQFKAKTFVQKFGDVVILPAGMAHEVRTTAPAPNRQHAYSFSAMLTPLSAASDAMSSLPVCTEGLLPPIGTKKQKLNKIKAAKEIMELKHDSATARSQWLATTVAEGKRKAAEAEKAAAAAVAMQERKTADAQAATAERARQQAEKKEDARVYNMARNVCSRAGFNYHDSKPMLLESAHELLSYISPPEGGLNTTKDIKKAYHRLVLLIHPDKHALRSEKTKKACDAAFKATTAAYEVALAAVGVHT